ncbi:hypothetical protein [Bombilactobacillus thymidiniphilus]|uniref:Uncharacterized protein n=1 Tax=Bombilactobacillus thymidiniphilus TaxID=2923363 RepID=A0ABY4PC74_9LACO|nr:hypothetical protein [Bombilactobacillus thymidiniphilus]UQS83190.1 hypothetical protein MOO47_05230 [Bombilactobacillus thymidiniphilus]
MSLLTRIWIADLDKKRLVYDLKTKKLLAYNLPKEPSKLFIKLMAVCIVISGGSSALAGISCIIMHTGTKMDPLIKQPYLTKVLLYYFISVLVGGLIMYWLTQREIERAGRMPYQHVGDLELKRYFSLNRKRYKKAF